MKFEGTMTIIVLPKYEEDCKEYINKTRFGLENALNEHHEWFDTYLSGIKEEEW